MATGARSCTRPSTSSPTACRRPCRSSPTCWPTTSGYRRRHSTQGDDMAFAMRDEWKEEPVSTTGAEYVEPSATELIKPGQRVSHLFPRGVMEEFVLQRVTERVWWVTRQFYGSLFYVGKRGVLLFDSFLGGADATLAAIASVTSLPVTAVVYSHFHADHVGGSRRLFELLAAAPPRVIASKHTAIWMSRFRSDLPRPADVLDWPSD